MPTQLDSRQSVLRTALGMVGSAANDSLDTIFPKINNELAKLFEDRNFSLISDGTVTFPAAGTSVTFSSNVRLHINSQVAGGTPTVVDLGSATRSLATNLTMVYAVIDRSAGTASITDNATTLPAVTSANQEVVLIAKRVDATDGTKRVYFVNGFTLSAGQTSRFGGGGTVFANEFSIADATDTTKTIIFQASGSSSGFSTTLASSATANRVLTLPDATDTLVGKATTDILTNKTLQFLREAVATDSTTTGSNVTLGAFTTGIVRLTNASLVSLSGIPAGLSGQSIIIENLTGTTITINNDEATASSANRIYTGSGGNVTMSNQASFRFIYDATSTKWMLVGGTGSGSGSGGVNYVTFATAEAGTQGWATYADAAGNIPVDGTGGTATGLTFSTSSSLPLLGLNSYVMTQANSTSLQGKGVSYDFSIDSAYKASVLQIQFNYNASSTFIASNGTTAPLNNGTTTTNAGNSDVEVFIYDVTNAVLLPVSPEVITANGANNFVFKGTFQASSNSTSYRLIFHVATASANATGWQFKFDGVSVGPQLSVSGSAITDWVSYTPTFTGFGTPTSIEFESRRVGSNLQIKGKFVSGTTTGVEGRISLGYNGGNSNVISSSFPSIKVCGFSVRSGTGAAQDYTLIEPNVGYVTFGIQDVSNAGLTKANANTYIANGLAFSFTAEVPIAGWSSTSVMSNDTDTRVVGTRVYRTTSSQTGITTATKLQYNATSYDKTGSWDSTNNQFVCPVSGLYKVGMGIYYSNSGTVGTSRRIDVYKNGASYAVLYIDYLTVSGDNIRSGSAEVECVAGDTLAIYLSSSESSGQNTGANFSYATFERLSGPATIAASETVSFSANNSTTAGTTSTPFIYTVKEHDTHNAYSTSTGKFTAPIAGKYCFQFNNYGGATIFQAKLHKNGTAIYQGSSTVANTSVGSGSLTVSMLAGDTMEIRPETNATASAGATLNNFSGFRVGN